MAVAIVSVSVSPGSPAARNTATPMPPSKAMPSAPPSSELVSLSADAAPARSAGAAPTTRSVVSAIAGPVPA